MNPSMRSGLPFTVLTGMALAAACFVPACSGGSGGGGGMSITSINLTDGTVWRINRPIRIEFSDPVDFSSVTLNSFNVRRVGGGPAAGEFYTENGGRIVVFQPLCPVLSDLSDAGLLAGTDPNNNGAAYEYELNIIGADKNSQLPVRSQSGRALALSQTRRFTTPVSTSPLNLYLDTRVGPPTANLRRVNANGCEILQGVPAADACNPPADAQPLQENILARYNPTYLERLDTSTVPPTLVQHRFTLDVENNVLFLEPPLPELPLNLLGDPTSQVALVIGINQAVDPAIANINSSRVRWEFTADASVPSPTWTPLTTNVELQSNCAIVGVDNNGDTVAVPGARVRVTPQGALPPGADLRAVLAAEFSDIVGETNPIAVSGFAEASTEPFPTNPATLVDEYLEDFDTAANDDANASFAEPHATWENGQLSSRFSFDGTGGPGGGFDWYLQPGEIVIFNTANSTISGFQLTFASPTNNSITSFLPIGNQTVVGGVVDVDDFVIEQGATLKIEGPNPFKLVAAGRVIIRGKIDVSGTSSAGVNTLNTTNIPEPGSPGQAGGGRGGTGSPLTTASSPRGGTGFGAFNVSDLGGQGGETGWSLLAADAKRRGAGGGGGVLGPNEFSLFPLPPVGTLFEQRRIGFDAEPGFNNNTADNGAISGVGPAFGGAVAPAPFTDPNPDNNFFGTRFVYPVAPSVTPTIIVGELAKPWAGAGGGAGGDAARVTSGTFPGPWSNGGDEKGSGGGGGGGSFQIMALGPIVFGPVGQIVNRGGLGGGGENTSFLNRVGGGSGGGSGGHVVLQSSSRIDFRDKNPVNYATAADINFAIDCRGGQGGAGNGDAGGAIQSVNGQKETLPVQDSCPPGYATTVCKGHTDGAGGDGGPGIIQLHTSAGLVGPPSSVNADIVLPPTAGLSLTDLCAPPPLSRDNTATTSTSRMIPTFGRTSRARSNWIALGEAGFNSATSTYRDVTFSFGGINPATGLITTTAGVVDPHETAMNAVPVALTATPASTAPPFIESDGFHAVVSGASLLPQFTPFLQKTAMMKHWFIVLSNGLTTTRFDVLRADYDQGTDRLRLTTDSAGLNMVNSVGINTTIKLERSYFRVNSSGVADSLPDSATVKLEFEATGIDPITGGPSTTTVIGPTSNIANLNVPSNGYLRFVRFSVLFDIAAQGQQLSPTNPVPALEFLRLPFSY